MTRCDNMRHRPWVQRILSTMNSKQCHILTLHYLYTSRRPLTSWSMNTKTQQKDFNFCNHSLSITPTHTAPKSQLGWLNRSVTQMSTTYRHSGDIDYNGETYQCHPHNVPANISRTPTVWPNTICRYARPGSSESSGCCSWLHSVIIVNGNETGEKQENNEFVIKN